MMYREISKFLAKYCATFALIICIPLWVAFYYEFLAPPEFHPQPHATWAFVLTSAVVLACGYGFYHFGKKAKGLIYRREGLILVVAIWLLTPLLAMLPFLFSGTLKNPVQAFFETVSGLTTTGSTIMQAKLYDGDGNEIPIIGRIKDSQTTTYRFWGTVEPVRDAGGEIVYQGVEAVGKAILFWRSFIQWIGGVGVLVLLIAVLPALGVGGKVLFQAESPGPIKETLTPRLGETAAYLWKIYLSLTCVQVFLLMLCDVKISFFDAICISFSTVSTGGFAVKNSSIGAYDNFGVYWIVILFMIIGSVNFSLYFYILRGKFLRLKDPELIAYLASLFFSGCFTAYWLWGTPKILLGPDRGGHFSWWEAITHGFFQTVSAQSSSGFATANYDLWPFAVQALLLIVMFLGGMSGSTAGGIKIMRFVILFRLIQHRIELLFRPTTVRISRVGKMAISSDAAQTVLSFFVVFIGATVLGVFLLVIDGVDPETALSVVASSINNVGITFREAGPTLSCAFLTTFGCLVSCFLMILGRLELFALLVILMPAFWKQRI